LNTQLWVNFGLLFHFLGIVILSGGVIGATMLDNISQSTLHKSPSQALAAGKMSKQFASMPQIGSLLMLLSGLGLLAAREWTQLGQPWLLAKLALFVVLTLNGALVAAPTSASKGQLLEQWLAVNGGIPSLKVATAEYKNLNRDKIKASLEEAHRRMRLFHLTEFTIFGAVIVLGVFKFA
jgi:uncharacterized membrane protein SirB2